MADVTAPEILEAYQNVRAKSDTNWLLLDYEGDRSDKLILTGTGTGGLEELQDTLDESRASFAYVRIKYSSDKESTREKFVLITWIGSGVKVMRKAKVSVHTGYVKQVLRIFSIEVSANSKEDLDEATIVARLKKAGGANYDGA
ncbi:hypothetical protein Clacol_009179 [Clathrus columnatus]|uniref:ADF-H domain-containing protein n=1 Tax=Clathrus columnatus TaxID=1419009 RepID=A0AAV5AJU6_9AGAM|nr:hypothetical protein Clacol_009179 [Clathrus columnatus]